MKYLFWEILMLIFGLWLTYIGFKGFKQSPKEFIAEREGWARKRAQNKEELEKEMKSIDYMRKEPAFWQLWANLGGLAGGFVLAFAAIALIIADFYT